VRTRASERDDRAQSTGETFPPFAAQSAAASGGLSFDARLQEAAESVGNYIVIADLENRTMRGWKCVAGKALR
jgi:hypothetical protein